MITIEVYGPGCQRCRATTAAVNKALQTLNVEATVQHITDPREMAKRGVMFTPTVKINGDLKCSGRVLSMAEVMVWITAALTDADRAVS